LPEKTNAIHTSWVPLLTNTKGRELFKVMQNNNLKYISTRQPTYWPSDPNKISDLLYFCVTKGTDTKKLALISCLELTSDHTPILITVFNHTLGKSKTPSLYSQKTDWNCFKETLDKQITVTIDLKTEIDNEESDKTTKAIQNAAWQATPDSNDPTYRETPINMKQKLAEKRMARKRCQLTRAPQDVTTK
jgi:hypothetical protein